MAKKYLLYLVRWQLSTPILALVLYFLASWDTLAATIAANLIGGLIFFWVDRLIFSGGEANGNNKMAYTETHK